MLPLKMKELFRSFFLIKNMRGACWAAQCWQLCQTINELRVEIIANSFQFNCGKPFICIHVGVAVVVWVQYPSNFCELALGWDQPRSDISTEAFIDMLCWKSRADTQTGQKTRAGYSVNLNIFIYSVLIN